MAIGQLENLGFRNRKSIDHRASETVGLHRIALAMILAGEVVDQPGKENPERIKQDLREIDVAGDGSNLHDDFSF